MLKRRDLLDFISIDAFLTEMVTCGGLSEQRYAELMTELDIAFERSRSSALDKPMASEPFTLKYRCGLH